MDELLRSINKYPNGTKLIIVLNSGVKIRGEIDTIYETDNGLEPDEDGYKEYYACVLKVKALLDNTKDEAINIGALIEVSMQEPPLAIWLEDNTKIW